MIWLILGTGLFVGSTVAFALWGGPAPWSYVLQALGFVLTQGVWFTRPRWRRKLLRGRGYRSKVCLDPSLLEPPLKNLSPRRLGSILPKGLRALRALGPPLARTERQLRLLERLLGLVADTTERSVARMLEALGKEERLHQDLRDLFLGELQYQDLVRQQVGLIQRRLGVLRKDLDSPLHQLRRWKWGRRLLESEGPLNWKEGYRDFQAWKEGWRLVRAFFRGS